MSRRYERSDSVNCMMCCKPSLANCVLEPCGHSPACDDCSSKMVLCITCDAIIGRRLKVIPVSKDVPDPREQSSSEAKECLVCNEVSKVGNCLLKPCGHSPACERCSATLTDCLTCDRHIEREPKTNILERNFSNSGSAVRNAGKSLSMSPDYRMTPEVKSEEANRCCLVCFGEDNVSLFDNGPEWAAKLYFCITCKQNIASRIKGDGSLAATTLKEQCPTASGGAILKQQPTQDKRGIYGMKSDLQERYLNSLKKNTVQTNTLCKVCNVKLRSMTFQCGHSACSECASKMTVCIVCKATITNRIKINSSDALPFKVQPLKTRFAECLVCLKMSEANTVLEPCGHALACEACSASINQCLICDRTVGTGGSKSFISPAESYPDNRTKQASTIGYYAERGQRVITGVLDECHRISEVISGDHSTKGHIEKKTPVTNIWKNSGQQEPYTMIRGTNPTYSSIATIKSGATSTNGHLKEVNAFAVANQRNPSLTTTTDECLLCNKNSKPNHALPCGHKPTCEGCSASLKQCLVCNATIVPQKAIDIRDNIQHRGSGVVKNNDCLVSREADESRSRDVNPREISIVRYDNTVVVSSGRSQVDGNNRYSDQSDDNCLICTIRKSTTTLQCGHSACPECASRLSICHICNKTTSDMVQNDESLPIYSEHRPMGNTNLLPYSSAPVIRSVQSSEDGGEQAISRCCLCLLRKKTTTFQCGHSACSKCASRFSACHVCKRYIGKGPTNNQRVLTAPKCIVCHQICKNNCYLHPCGHGPTCEDCAATMRNCFFCRKVIGRRMTADNCEIPYRGNAEVKHDISTSGRIHHAVAGSVDQVIKNNPLLQRDDGGSDSVIICKVDVQVVQPSSEQRAVVGGHGSEVRPADTVDSRSDVKYVDRYCNICMNYHKVVVFQCNHGSCAECADHKRHCPTCGDKITSRSYAIL